MTYPKQYGVCQSLLILQNITVILYFKVLGVLSKAMILLLLLFLVEKKAFYSELSKHGLCSRKSNIYPKSYPQKMWTTVRKEPLVLFANQE